MPTNQTFPRTDRMALHSPQYATAFRLKKLLKLDTVLQLCKNRRGECNSASLCIQRYRKLFYCQTISEHLYDTIIQVDKLQVPTRIQNEPSEQVPQNFWTIDNAKYSSASGYLDKTHVSSL